MRAKLNFYVLIPALLLAVWSLIESYHALSYILQGDEDIIRYLIDVDVYRLGGLEFRHGGDLYSQRFYTRIIDLPFTYPPFGALVFVPLSFFDQVTVELILSGLSVVCLWASMAMVLNYIRIPYAGLWALGTLAFALNFEPVVGTLAFGQINLVLLSLVIADITGAIPKLPRGVLIGIAAAIKLTPAYFGLYFLAKADWKGALGTIGGFLAATGCAALVHWNTSWQYFTQVLIYSNRIGNPEYATNVSFAGVNARLFDTRLPWLLATIAITLLAFFAARRAIRTKQDLLALLVVALGGLCASPISWSHHWVWLVPGIIILTAAGHLPLAIWAWWAMWQFDWQTRLPIDHQQELHWTLSQHLLGSHYLIIAVVTILAVFVLPQGPLWRLQTTLLRSLRPAVAL